MIDLRSVSFGYTRKKLLFESLSLTLAPGHIYGLLGLNGAGKSSLLRLMTGLLFPTGGSIRVLEHEPKRRLPAFLTDVYFLPEELYLPPVLPDRFVRTMGPFYPRFSEAQFRQYLQAFDVPTDQLLTTLSYGQKKKVLISFGLAANTSILIMDEPTNGLDIPSKSQFRKLVSSALDENRTVLLSTHQVRDLDNLIDSVVILDESGILLNHSLETIAERLRFTTLTEVGQDERVLYAEPSLRGYMVVMENPAQETTKVDLERLFSAVMNNHERVRQLFKN